jgi:putative ABC transport system permease protein
MNGLWQDVRYGVRQLRKSPGFTAIAVITLALGIGANTAIFSVVNGILLRPLPYHKADRLMAVWHVPPQKSFPGMTRFSVSAANYIDWHNQNHVFEKMAIFSYHPFTFTGGDKPEQVDATSVSADFFATLGVQPAMGRVFNSDEDQPGHGNVVLLSHRFWQDHFASNRDIVGRSIRLDGASFLVAGVMPANFRMPDFAQMWTPMAWTDQEKAVRGEHHYSVIGRLKDGVGLKQAQAEMNTISNRLEQQYPEDDRGWGALVVPLHEDLVSDVRPALLVLLGAVGCILLIACVNVVNLSLAKTFSRQKEIAIRTAMGATSARVVRQVLVESILLALLGGALGLAYAHSGVRLIMAFLADKVPHSVDVGLDLKVLAFTLLVSVCTGVIAGILPALSLSRANVNEALKQGLGRTDTDSGGNRTRNILVVVEVSLSLVLLVGAGLLIRSFKVLREVDPGFQSGGVLTQTVAVSRTKFSNIQQEVAFFDRVLENVRTLPSVVAAGIIDNIPLGDGGSHQPIAVEGYPTLPMSEQPEVDVRAISPGYMGSLRIPLLSGRDLDSSDIAGRPPVALISASLARQFWPNESPLGKHIGLTFSKGAPREIVGVIGDVKGDSLDQKRPAAMLYYPLAQHGPSAVGEFESGPMTLVVRSASNPKNLITPVANVVQSIDREIPVRDVLTMEELVANSLSQQRFNLLLLGAFAGLALVLAAIGIYSVLSYSVRRRIQEIGIRLALGATLSDVFRMIVVEGMKPTLLGVAIGAAGALALGRVMSSFIYGVSSTDPITFFAVAFALAMVALLASVIPALRAARVDPIVALHYE